MHQYQNTDPLRRSADDVMRSLTWKRACRACRPHVAGSPAPPRPITDGEA